MKTRMLLALLLAAGLSIAVSSCQQDSQSANPSGPILPMSPGSPIIWNAHPVIAYQADTNIGTQHSPNQVNGLYVMDSTGKNWRCVTASGSYGGLGNWRIPSWSNDGTSVCWAAGNSGNYYVLKTKVSVVNGIPTGSGITAVVSYSTSDSLTISQAAWSPTASTIAYTASSTRNPHPAGFPGYVYTVPSGGGSPSLLYSHDSMTIRYITWSPDGSKIALSCVGPHGASILVINSSGTLLDSIGRSGPIGQLDWARTSGKIAYVNKPSGSTAYNLYTIDTTAGASASLIRNNVNWISWSPTDWKIAFTTGVTGSPINVTKVSLGDIAVLRSNGGYGFPGWKR